MIHDTRYNLFRLLLEGLLKTALSKTFTHIELSLCHTPRYYPRQAINQIDSRLMLGESSRSQPPQAFFTFTISWVLFVRLRYQVKWQFTVDVYVMGDDVTVDRSSLVFYKLHIEMCLNANELISEKVLERMVASKLNVCIT